MHSQVYLSGRLASNRELEITKKGHFRLRLLLETFVRPIGRGGYQAEQVILPINCFAREVELVKDLKPGDSLTGGCHLYSSRYETNEGVAKYEVQLTADVFYRNRNTEGGKP